VLACIQDVTAAEQVKSRANRMGFIILHLQKA
jgi:hypothetical protein